MTATVVAPTDWAVVDWAADCASSVAYDAPPPKRSIAKSVMKIATMGTRSGVLLWWYISHPSSLVVRVRYRDVKVLIQLGWKSERTSASSWTLLFYHKK